MRQKYIYFFYLRTRMRITFICILLTILIDQIHSADKDESHLINSQVISSHIKNQETLSDELIDVEASKSSIFIASSLLKSNVIDLANEDSPSNITTTVSCEPTFMPTSSPSDITDMSTDMPTFAPLNIPSYDPSYLPSHIPTSSPTS